MSTRAVSLAGCVVLKAPETIAVRSQRSLRGWVVLAGVFGVMFITSGMVFYALGAYLDALVDEQGFSTGLAGAGISAFLVASGLCGYYMSGFINRIDVRWIITAGILVSSIGMALLAQIRSGWQMFAVMTIFGVGFGLCGLVPTTTIVTRWFERQRSIALAIASTGLSLGGNPATATDSQTLRGGLARGMGTTIRRRLLHFPSAGHVALGASVASQRRAGAGRQPHQHRQPTRCSGRFRPSTWDAVSASNPVALFRLHSHRLCAGDGQPDRCNPTRLQARRRPPGLGSRGCRSGGPYGRHQCRGQDKRRHCGVESVVAVANHVADCGAVRRVDRAVYR